MRKKITLLVLIVGLANFYAQTLPSPVNLETGYSVHNDGYLLYPSPENAYTTILEVGPGKTYTEIHDIPYTLITPGTLVKIYYRPTPYLTKILLNVQASENNKVRFQGIPDENGTLPVISFTNATLWGNTPSSGALTIATGSLFIVYDVYNVKPSWIDIVNLHLRDAPYAGVWAQADHVSIKGCILNNNANGVFFQANDQNILEISTNMLIEGNLFMENGSTGSNADRHHNIYAQGRNSTIQFNTLQRVKDGSLGTSLKDRSSFTVVRYNRIETSSRSIDLVEPEDTDQVLTVDANWGDAYVYGNLIINDHPSGSTAMIHYGYDNVPTYRREGTLYFANNTIYVDRTGHGLYKVSLFDVNSTVSNIQFSNNILYATGMNQFNIFRSNNTDNAGAIAFETSWLSVNGTDDPTSWQLNDLAGSYSMTGTPINGNGINAGFTAVANGDYTLTGSSPSLALGTNLNATIGLNVNYNSITTLVELARTDQANPNLGAFSSDTATASILDETLKKSISTSYPNPFENSTTIQYSLANDTFCTITITNSIGQVIKKLVNSTQVSGNYRVAWDGSSMQGKKVSKGLYFYTITTKNHIESKKMLLK
ncbi:T9SS type A sorting domain-containing protein [uncultured Polaribacter sp.]|uniref:T9SS type A sorting domain-containing protein n=1 Tax=uncultured Polaribacter sp. TaxID=174711 RepID=UPI002604235D|nr:T9SS type A sorting domain-containing protein [uncultured Polaribacter sp.]